MSSGSKLSEELDRLNDEARSIDAQIHQLRSRRKEIGDKIASLESRIAARASAAGGDEALAAWESDAFEWSGRVRETLRVVFRLDEFRPLQRSAINLAMSGEDCLLIMSTGGGKSLTYQLPAVVKKGVTLVVSPLVSLIEDQIIQLTRLGIRTATLNQHSTKEEVKSIYDALGNAVTDLRLLYVTPEKLAKSKRIMNRLEKCAEIGAMALIAVDEVHCCSQWGHDFRPDYQFLNVLKRQFRGVPLLGLTATATVNVLEDVKKILGLKGAVTLRATFNRENLFYEVRPKPATSAGVMAELVAVIDGEFRGQTGIVYCFSRKECEEVAAHLQSCGVAAAYYHAYLEPDRRRRVHEQWLTGRYKVIVATLAFGMGIDKSDVRFVIHHSIAKSMENYYQESGRAGRDGKQARCILYYRLADLFRQSTMVCSEKNGVENLYAMLAYLIRNMDCRRVCIAEHFEESWDASWCRRMCDVCVDRESSSAVGSHTTKMNAAPILRAAVETIRRQAKTEQGRITGNKLLDVLTKHADGQKVDRVTLETIVGRLLLDGYLREDFHFTPYSIISYVRTTERVERAGTSEIAMEVATMATDKTVRWPSGSSEPVKKKRQKAPNDDDDNDTVLLE